MQADADVVRALHSRRLERAMCSRRTWPAATFRSRLVGHPLLGRLARRLLWESCDAKGRGEARFRVTEDRSLADVGDRAVGLADGALVRLPHPVEVEVEERAAWSALFGEYRILQPFEQLGRPVFTMTEEERTAKGLDRLEGARTSRERLLALSRHGWRPAMSFWEAGDFEPISRTVRGTPYWVELEVREDGTLGSVTLKEGSDWTVLKYHPFGKLDAIQFSELVRDLEAARA
jgi:hypothetical protein